MVTGRAHRRTVKGMAFIATLPKLVGELEEVERHGGTIAAENNAHGGSTFTFTPPKSPAAVVD
jgi:signal transduction histidine kinase